MYYKYATTTCISVCTRKESMVAHINFILKETESLRNNQFFLPWTNLIHHQYVDLNLSGYMPFAYIAGTGWNFSRCMDWSQGIYKRKLYAIYSCSALEKKGLVCIQGSTDSAKGVITIFWLQIHLGEVLFWSKLNLSIRYSSDPHGENKASCRASTTCQPSHRSYVIIHKNKRPRTFM